MITSFSNMDSDNDYGLYDDWDQNLVNDDNFDDNPPQINSPIDYSVNISEIPEVKSLPESAINTSNGVPFIPQKPVPRVARLDPFVTWQPTMIEIVSEPQIMHITEAKPFCKSKGYKGFIFAPARILSHVRSDKRRFLDDINVQFFETK